MKSIKGFYLLCAASELAQRMQQKITHLCLISFILSLQKLRHSFLLVRGECVCVGIPNW